MVILVKLTHSSPSQFADFQNVDIHSCHLLFDHFQFALIHGPNLPGSYAILIFIALILPSITSPIHNWVLFLLWLHFFILSGIISPLISNNILGTYQPGEFIFQFPIFLHFHTVYGVPKARILKWFAIPFSSGPQSVRPLHHDLSFLGGRTRHGLVSLSQTRLWSCDLIGQFSVVMVLVCLSSDALSQRLPSYLGFFYLGRGVSLHGCSSKGQPLLLTLDVGQLQ